MCFSFRAMQVKITMKVVQGVYKGVTTSELDELAAETGEDFVSILLHGACWHRRHDILQQLVI